MPQYNPKIYYKVFITQKVTDIGESAPRNYAIENMTGV